MITVKQGLIALVVSLTAAAPSAAAVPLFTDKSLAPEIMDELMHSQDLAMDLQYSQADTLLSQARAKAPEHPLGGVFLLATRLAQMQESIRQGHREVPKNFFVDVDQLIEQAQEQAKVHPESAYPKYYLGAALGCRGLAKLYTGHYLDSYFDGKNGVGLVREAVAMEPTLYDAYMGLGQFEYYCGSLGAMLRFVLALHGSEEKGLAMLQTCGEKATYAAWPCRLYRVKLLISERKDFKSAVADLSDLMARYPDNYDLAHEVFECLDHDATSPVLIQEGNTLLARLKSGWDVPDYTRFNVSDCERIMLKANGVREGRQ